MTILLASSSVCSSQQEEGRRVHSGIVEEAGEDVWQERKSIGR